MDDLAGLFVEDGLCTVEPADVNFACFDGQRLDDVWAVVGPEFFAGDVLGENCEFFAENDEAVLREPRFVYGVAVWVVDPEEGVCAVLVESVASVAALLHRLVY